MGRPERSALPDSTALHDAAGAGNSEAVTGLLYNGADVDARIGEEEPLYYANGVTALHVAAQRGHLEVVLALLEGGAGPNGGWHELYSDDVESTTGDWHYWCDRSCENDLTPLHEAVVRGHAGIVRILLASGARKNARASMARCRYLQPGNGKMVSEHEVGGHVPLHFAARSGQPEVVHALVEAGASVNILGGNEAETPLHIATRHGHTAVMLALLHRGADINAGDVGNRTALHAAASVSAVEFLLAAGADGNGRATHCAPPLPTDTPLGRLCTRTHVRWTNATDIKKATTLVQAFLRCGVNTVPITHSSELFKTAASTTCSRRSTTLDHPQHAQGAGDSTSSSCSSTSCSTLDSSVDCKSSCSSPDSASGSLFNSKPLSPGCTRSTGATKALISPSGSNEDLPGTTSSAAEPTTPRTSLLFYAAKNGVPGIVGALLGAGLNPRQRDHDGVTAAHYAAQEGHLETLRLLLQAGADPNATIRLEKWTPLHVACYCDRLGCVIELLRHGASLKARCFLPGVGVQYDASASRTRFRTPFEMVGLRWYSSNPRRRTPPPRLKYEEDEVEQEGCAEGTSAAAALPATATATATATSTSAAISTAISTATGLAGERGTGVTIRNAIRHVLRREDRWRRRGGLIVFQALLNKRMRRTITSAANTTITTAPATTPTNTTPNITTATLPASAVRHKTSKIEASLETNATTTTKTNTNTKTINGNHGRTDDFSDDLPEHFSEECSGGGGVLGGGATPPVSKIGKYEEERGRGKHASGAMEANERDRLLGALVGLMDLSWGREFLFRQIVMRL